MGDIRARLPWFEMKTILDVGANVGQSALTYSKHFPKATIHCFEPVSETFLTLQKRVKRHKTIYCHHLAIGARQGHGRVTNNKPSLVNHLFDATLLRDEPEAGEAVEIDTVAHFCGRNRLDRVNFLKVDTEGNDFAVLQGAGEMLASHKIDLIMIEVGLNSKNRFHVPMEMVKNHLEGLGYLLFGIYNQMNEWPTKEPQLRRADLMFLSDNVRKGSKQ